MALDKNIGMVTAYAYAVSKGYTGTEEQFAQELASAGADLSQIQTQIDNFINTIVPAKTAEVTAEGTRQIGLVAAEGTAQKNAVTEEGTTQKNAVISEGTTQKNAVNSAGSTQVNAVNSAGSTQVGNVNTAGSTQVGAVQAKGQEVINSIPSDYTALSDDVDDLKSALIDGDAVVNIAPSWINAYVTVQGLVRASTASKTGLIPLEKGQTVTVGTRNANIGIICSTTADSIEVGDTITVIQKTTLTDRFETYSYTAKEDINIVVCVNASEYSLVVTQPIVIPYLDERCDGFEIDISLLKNGYTSVPLVWENGQIISGDDQPGNNQRRTVGYTPCIDGYKINVSYSNVSVSVYVYEYDEDKNFITSSTVSASNVVFPTSPSAKYIRMFTYSATVPQAQQEQYVKATYTGIGVFDYIPHAIIDGYIEASPVANGSFTGAGGPNIGASNRIRTDLIPFVANDKIVIDSGSMQYAVGMWNGTPSTATKTRNDSSFLSGTETIIPDYNGYIVIVFKNTSDIDIIPSDFDGSIDVYNTLAYRAYVKQSDSAEIPDYYMADNYLLNKANRINTLGESADDVFIFITDVHWELNAKHSPELINYLADKCKIARLFDGGDLADAVIPEAIKAYKDNYDGKIYRLCGNHDWFPPEDGKSLYYWLNSDNYDQIGEQFEHYWYVDNVQQKIRYITLNSFTHSGDTTASGWEYGFDANQIAWFTNTALNLPSTEWDVIVFTHYLRTTSISITGGSDIESAIDTFNADTSHTGKILAVLQGHTHWDGVYHTAGGVPVITTTCDKWDLSNESELAQEQAGRVLGTISEQAFDVMVLNRTARTITAVRIGALAQNNVDKYRTDTGFEWVGTLEERVINY